MLCVIEAELLATELLTCEDQTGWLSIFLTLFLLLWPWPWPDNLHIRTWSVLPGYIADVQIWASYVKAFESYRLTDIQTYIHTDRQTDRQTESTKIINHATASRVVNDTITTTQLLEEHVLAGWEPLMSWSRYVDMSYSYYSIN